MGKTSSSQVVTTLHSSSNGTVTRKRTRASKPKVRTGCLTCKIRRVKCGEEKPTCTRCSSTGRTCDGYDVRAAPSRNRAEDSLRSLEQARRDFIRAYHQQQQQGQQAGSSGAMRPLQADIAGTEAERRFFHDFRQVASGGLAIHVSNFSTFWQRFVPQLSHQDEAVRHAIVALGAAYQLHREGSTLETSSSSPARTDRGHGRHAAAALPGFTAEDLDVFTTQQYTQAMSRLARSSAARASPPTPESLRITLVCCLAFICLETLRANPAAALTHLTNGLAILETVHASDVDLLRGYAPADPAPPPSPDPCAGRHVPSDMGDIVWSFSRLEVGAALFAADVKPVLALRVLDRVRFDHYEQLPPFAGLAAAHAHVCCHARTVLARCWEARGRDGDAAFWARPREALAQTALRARSRKVQLLYRRFLAGPDAPRRGTPEYLSVQADLLHMAASEMFVGTMAGVSEDGDGADAAAAAEGREKAEKLMAEMIGLVESMLPQMKKTGNNKHRAYVSDVGVVGPLYIVAVTTKDVCLRQQALELMEETNTREGFWDGPAVQQLVKRVFRLMQENKLAADQVPRGLSSLWSIPSLYEKLATVKLSDEP